MSEISQSKAPKPCEGTLHTAPAGWQKSSAKFVRLLPND